MAALPTSPVLISLTLLTSLASFSSSSSVVEGNNEEMVSTKTTLASSEVALPLLELDFRKEIPNITNLAETSNMSMEDIDVSKLTAILEPLLSILVAVLGQLTILIFDSSTSQSEIEEMREHLCTLTH